MIFKMFALPMSILTLGVLNGVTAAAISRSAAPLPGFVSSRGNSSLVARMAPYDGDPDFNPHLNAPDVSSNELCERGRTLENIDATHAGNWYCQKADQILCTKVTKPGTYEEMTFMDNKFGECRFGTREFKGDIAPYNEPLSIIFRGPMRLKQFSVYTPSGGGSYNRIGEYHAATQTRNGIMFLGNRGGAGSGVPGGPFSASLFYVSKDGLTGSSGPQTIHDAPWSRTPSSSPPLTSLVMDLAATDALAQSHTGFPGSARVFLFKFSLLDEPQHNNDEGNKPAIWLLNSRIPNTAQYHTCNCWEPGCGGLDFFEIL